MNIRVNLNTNIADGSEVVFRSPADCSQVTGLVIYHTGGKTEFAFADAHGHNVGDIDHLFAENAVVKVILDVTAGMAFVQNADTNAYIERTFIKAVNGAKPDKDGNVELKINEAIGSGYVDVTEAYEQALASSIVSCAKEYLWSLGAGRYSIADRDPDGTVVEQYYLQAFAGEEPIIGRILYTVSDFMFIEYYTEDRDYRSAPKFCLDGDGGVSFEGKDIVPPDGVQIDNGVLRLTRDGKPVGQGAALPSGGTGTDVSVKDYGAVGDGVADDTAAIQAALDASHASGGGTVVIPNGTYLLSDAVRFYSNQHIIGEPGAVLLQKDGTTGVAYSSESKGFCNLMRNYYNGAGGYDATENVVIEGITFDGGTQEENATTTMGLCHSRNIRVVGCTFVNGYSDSSHSNGHDIEVNSSSNVTISDCVFRNNRRKGYTSELVQLDNASGSQAYPWMPDEGSRTDDGTVSDTVRVDGCLFDGTPRDVLAEKNAFVGGHSSTACRNVIVSNCIMRNGSYGVKFGTVDSVTVKNNTIIDTVVGLYITDTVDSALAVGNTCLGDVQRVYPTTKVKGHGNMLNGVHVEEPAMGEGGGIEVSGAEVGQILKVKEVDENGVPTAWETAEMPTGGGDEWELIVDYTVPEGVQVDTLEFTKDLNGNDFDLKKCIFYTVITATEESAPNSGREINCITSKSAKKYSWNNGVTIGGSQPAGDPTSTKKGYMVYLEVVGNTYLTYGYTSQNNNSLWYAVGQSTLRTMGFNKTTNVMHDGSSGLPEINCFRIHSLDTNIMGVGSTIKILGVRK